MGLLEDLKATYPYLDELGMFDLIVGEIRDDADANELMNTVYHSTQYQKMFPGMYDENGRRRFDNEREYMDRIEDYRTVLRQFGAYDAGEDTPVNYLGFITLGMQPGELQKRFEKYREVERAGQDVRDAYYVYAGMDVSTDDLYLAMVDPQFGQQLTSEYDRQVASSAFNYETFITRATERGLERVAEQLEIMQRRNLVTGSVVSNLLAVDPDFAREVMGSLFTGGAVGQHQALSLDELLVTFDYAMIGSAAREKGLEMPDKERIERLRQAGVDRAKALRGYSAFSEQRTALRAMADRARAGADINQKLWEEAVFIGDAEAGAQIDRATSTEKALGQNRSGFQLGQAGRRVTQQGRR